MTTDLQVWQDYVLRDYKKLKEAERTPENLLRRYCGELAERLVHWKSVLKHGCQDPFWPDGVNMNLTRNHVIFCKACIIACCNMYGLELPEEFFLPVPPEVESDYMAPQTPENKYQKLRIERFLIRKKCRREPVYEEEQLCMF